MTSAELVALRPVPGYSIQQRGELTMLRVKGSLVYLTADEAWELSEALKRALLPIEE
jgi:hypothetical protein